ncbi:Maebl [Staphylococcus sp. HMSC068D08]|uniref:Maebl n=1 Tax=Staphylococcus TaxID=1279 RepID=UPI0008A1F8B8|nr:MULTISPECIES: Maebl [Staphylococcus]MCC2085155.1 Maebl [Staphylococcus lugdunensis]MCH8680962.1 Maebl [Staphylococcus lugdunensis]MCI2755386.1 Maebl [Staphylococcus lugdunensis]MCI2824227.1 Maebl [Staphylococcus lugdunensis]MCI2827249.1 Maebl [Staphylococcus lugdunensis]
MSQKFNQQPLEHTHSGDILSHDSYQHQNLTPYSNEVPKRKDFVVSFITGAIIGSTIGLLYKNKGFEKIDELKKKEQELEQKYLNIKEQAETNFNAIKSKIEDFKQQDSISPDEIAAQQQAIKEEVNDTLKDDSPEAQEIQQAKAEAKEENKKEASATEIAAQQQAIKHETNDTLKAPSNKTKKMMVNNQAQRLAQAAKGKAQKMEQDSSVTAKTKALLTEPELKFVKVERVPNLVTKPSINQPEAQIKDQQTHQSAHFDNGVITHEEKSIQQDNSTKNERKSTPKQAQRVEKAKSKIDKRTFND